MDNTNLNESVEDQAKAFVKEANSNLREYMVEQFCIKKAYKTYFENYFTLQEIVTHMASHGVLASEVKEFFNGYISLSGAEAYGILSSECAKKRKEEAKSTLKK